MHEVTHCSDILFNFSPENFCSVLTFNFFNKVICSEHCFHNNTKATNYKVYLDIVTVPDFVTVRSFR